MLHYAIIGFGGLGKVHFSGYAALREKHPDVNLAALCDVDETQFTTSTSTNLGADKSPQDLSSYHLYTDVSALLDNETLDFVVAAVPTYLHDTVAYQVMERGIHLFSEKPMALSLERARAMLEASKKHNVHLMIGQCVRFFLEYQILKNLAEEKTYGKVIKAEFSRISATPHWSWENWYMDAEKSGGAALDLHVHDIDFINHLFGKPKAVTSVATNEVSKHDFITTVYHYDGPVVTAVGDWGLPTKYPFSPGYRVKFEQAALELKDGKCILYTEDRAEEVPVPPGNGYVNELVDFIDCLKENRESRVNPPADTLVTMAMAMAEKQSAILGQTVAL